MKRKKNRKFKPNRAYIEKAVVFYLANGGTITRIEPDENYIVNYWTNSDIQSDVDEFLNGT